MHPYRTSTLRRARGYRFPIERVALTVTALVVTMSLVLLGYARSHRVETCWHVRPDGTPVVVPCDPP